VAKQRDEWQSRVWIAAMQREEWLCRKMDVKGERWVVRQRDEWLRLIVKLSREMNAKTEYGWQPCRERSG
jgi:hypothetical protein